MRRKYPAMLAAAGKVAVRPRTLLFALFVAALVFTFVQLSQWQWGRHLQRDASNDRIRTALAQPPAPLADILPKRSTPIPANASWRKVQVSGRYDTAHQLLVRYRSYGDTGAAGYEVLTPLVTADGRIWVDRGWVAAGVDGKVTLRHAPVPPAPPAGVVTVTGYLRASEPLVGQAEPDAGQVRSIYLNGLDDWYGHHTYDAYISRTRDQPAAPSSPRVLPTVELSSGPFLFYSIQWLIFALIAIAGWVKLMADDVVVAYTGKPRPPRGARRAPQAGPRPPTGPRAGATAHGTAGRPRPEPDDPTRSAATDPADTVQNRPSGDEPGQAGSIGPDADSGPRRHGDEPDDGVAADSRPAAPAAER